MNFLDNITFRRTHVRTQSDPVVDDSGDIISQTLECTTNSMPDISDDEDNDEVRRLKDEIKKYEAQLNSAHREIEILTLENNQLKLSNEDLIKKNNLYKQVATNSPIKSKANTPKKKSQINCKTKETQTDSNLKIDSATKYNKKPFSSNSVDHIDKSISQNIEQPTIAKKV